MTALESDAGSSTDSGRNRAIVANLYQAIARGDAETLFALMSPGVIIEEPAFLPYGGRYEGIAAAQGMIAQIAPRVDFSTLAVERLLADGDWVCAVAHAQLADGSGALQFIERFRLQDGMIAEIRIYVFAAGSLVAEG